jgi:hypothetical protein
VTQARILFGELPRMTVEIVEDAIAEENDMFVVGRTSDAELRAAVDQHKANIVIVGDRAVAENLHTQLVGIYPHLKVVALTSGGEARVYALRTLHLSDPSPAALLDLIRSVLQQEQRGSARE